MPKRTLHIRLDGRTIGEVPLDPTSTHPSESRDDDPGGTGGEPEQRDFEPLDLVRDRDAGAGSQDADT